MNRITSLYPRLVEHYEKQITYYERQIAATEQDLARVAMLHSGQLQLFEVPLFQEGTSEHYVLER